MPATEEKDSKSGPGWLKRMFAGDKETQPAATNETLSAETDKSSNKVQDFSYTTSAASSNISAADDNRVLETTLLGFIKRMSFPKNLFATAQRHIVQVRAINVPYQDDSFPIIN